MARLLAGIVLSAGFLIFPSILSAQTAQCHVLESPFQPGPQEIRVLLPDGYDGRREYPVLYVLPVGAGRGSALPVLQQMDIPNRYGLVAVEMTFAIAPWYGDHPSDPLVRQESYLRDFVLPYVEKNYAVIKSPEGRLLFGFSKSGWGAFSLILRNPDVFGYAAAWDAPFLLAEFHYGMDRVFGTGENLAEYRPDLLAVRQKERFQNETRLVLGGENKWGTLVPTAAGGSHTKEMHELLAAHSIPHVYRPDLAATHSWNEAWMEPMIRELLALARQEGPAKKPQPASDPGR